MWYEQHAWGSVDNSVDSVVSFHLCVDSGTELSSPDLLLKHLNLLSRPEGPFPWCC